MRSVTQECRSARCVWSVGFLFWYSCFWDPFLENSLAMHHNMLGKNAHLFLSKFLNAEVTSFFNWEGDYLLLCKTEWVDSSVQSFWLIVTSNYWMITMVRLYGAVFAGTLAFFKKDNTMSNNFHGVIRELFTFSPCLALSGSWKRCALTHLLTLLSSLQQKGWAQEPPGAAESTC